MTKPIKSSAKRSPVSTGFAPRVSKNIPNNLKNEIVKTMRELFPNNNNNNRRKSGASASVSPKSEKVQNLKRLLKSKKNELSSRTKINNKNSLNIKTKKIQNKEKIEKQIRNLEKQIRNA
jgi:hypothetical protein